MVISLENDGNIIEGELPQHATEYYFDLFCPREEHNIHGMKWN